MVKNRSRWRLYWLFFFLAIIGYLGIGSRSLLEMSDHRSELALLHSRIELLSAEKDSLERVLWRLENDLRFVEKVAREEYGMSKKNERVYQISKMGEE